MDGDSEALLPPADRIHIFNPNVLPEMGVLGTHPPVFVNIY